MAWQHGTAEERKSNQEFTMASNFRNLFHALFCDRNNQIFIKDKTKLPSYIYMTFHKLLAGK